MNRGMVVVLQKEKVRDGEVGLSVISGVVVFVTDLVFSIYTCGTRRLISFFSPFFLTPVGTALIDIPYHIPIFLSASKCALLCKFVRIYLDWFVD